MDGLVAYSSLFGEAMLWLEQWLEQGNLAGAHEKVLLMKKLYFLVVDECVEHEDLGGARPESTEFRSQSKAIKRKGLDEVSVGRGYFWESEFDNRALPP